MEHLAFDAEAWRFFMYKFNAESYAHQFKTAITFASNLALIEILHIHDIVLFTIKEEK
jgi:hypothetical protein